MFDDSLPADITFRWPGELVFEDEDDETGKKPWWFCLFVSQLDCLFSLECKQTVLQVKPQNFTQ